MQFTTRGKLMFDQVDQLKLIPRKQDFWRLTVSASLACRDLITWYVRPPAILQFPSLLIKPSKPIDWKSARGDVIKRVYWHCVIMETSVISLPVNRRLLTTSEPYTSNWTYLLLGSPILEIK